MSWVCFRRISLAAPAGTQSWGSAEKPRDGEREEATPPTLEKLVGPEVSGKERDLEGCKLLAGQSAGCSCLRRSGEQVCRER